MPIDVPPPEIIDALEKELDATFVHFTVSKEGIVEGIFRANKESKEPKILTVGFEAKREILNIDAQLKLAMSEMDDTTLKALRGMLESLIEDLDEELSESEPTIEPDVNFTPNFSGDWFIP